MLETIDWRRVALGTLGGAVTGFGFSWANEAWWGAPVAGGGVTIWLLANWNVLRPL